jgi:hypothetical protein
MMYLRQHLTILLAVMVIVSLGFGADEKSQNKSVTSVTPGQRGVRAPQNLVDINADNEGRVEFTGINPSVNLNEPSASPAPNMPLNKSVKQAYTAGLTGTYTIPGDFASISDAVAVLNFVGVSGNVTLELASASYNVLAPVTFGAFPGAGTYTVTMQPAAATAVTVNFQPSATQGKGFAFNGAVGVTIDGLNTGGASLTLGFSGGTFPTSDPFGATVYITGGSADITIANTTVNGQANNPVWASQTDGRPAIFSWAANADPYENYGITIDGCTLVNATYGLKVLSEGDWLSVGNMTVTNNHIGGAYGNPTVVGALVELAYQSVFSNNTFDGVRELSTYNNSPGAAVAKTYTEYDLSQILGASPAGRAPGWLHGTYGPGVWTFYLGYVDGMTVAGNVVKNSSSDNVSPTGQVAIGARVAYFGSLGFASQPLIYNNRFSLAYPNINNVAGLRSGGNLGKIYHNSVRLSGPAAASATALNCFNGGGSGTVYNNAFSNEMTGASATITNAIVAGGTIDNNALYSVGRIVNGQATVNAAVAAGVNPNGTFGPVSFDADLHITAGATGARQIGKSHVLLQNDVDGTPRDTTNAGTRDAGADEFSPLGTALSADALPAGFVGPPAAVPTGVPQTPIARIKNNSNSPAGPFTVNLVNTDGYNQNVVVSLLGGEIKNVAFPGWTPVGVGPSTFTVTTMLGGDATPGNDVGTLIVTASAPVAPPATYTFDASAEGWTGAVDWVRSSSFTKLGGVNGGSGFSWVTQRPNNIATYTEGSVASTQGYGANYPGANILMSPWLDISGITGTDLYISFQHSIEVEPLWDRSWLQYTVDGITWTDLGVLNDPNGINWYNESLYEYAALDPVNFDEATSQIYGLGNGPLASWTSNDNGTTGNPGNGVPNGPSGYVYVQLHVTETSHAALVGSPNVRFRYIAFSDASTAFGGWAFDNFSLGNAAPIFSSGDISGHAWTDANGNGVDDGEADITSTKLYISLFGTVFDSTTTDGSGDYLFDNKVTLPAAYGVTLNVSGVAFTVPYGLSNTASVNHPSTGGTVVQNFGTFIGGIAGMKFSDVNDNGVNDAEPGVSGWTIEAHQDSANGALIGSDVTDGAGLYSILLPPGTFVAKEVAQPTVARRTAPGGAGTYTVVVNNVTPLHTAKDFGNFLYGRMRVSLNVDANGNGIKDGADVIAVPSGFSSTFIVAKNGTPIDTVVLGNGTIAAQYNGLDTATYTVTEVDSIAGWRRTKGGPHSFTENAGGLPQDDATYLDFKYLVITGTKYNDLNGDGVKDLGEPGLAGWTINVSGGTYYGATSAVTDSLGAYSIDSVFTGTHTVSEVAQAGWTQTTAAIPTINGVSGNLINTTGKNFGNFDQTDISGLVYRDYNGNGVKDAEDVVMTGVSIDLSSGPNDVTDGSGYSFSGVLTVDTVRITVPGGYVVTQPAAGEYPLALTSGGAATSQNFGLFQSSDSTTKYRTFTADQLSADDQKKPGAKPKPGKAYDPVKNKPSTGNLVDALINPKTGFFPNAIVVGLPGQLNIGGKTKAYVVPNKQGAFWASLNNKGNKHDGMARGFDVDVKGKPFLKLQKAFAPGKKQDNKLFGELLALKLNLLASGVSTPAGLGVLIYSDPASDFNGWTIDEIADYADTVMTNFEFMPLGIYTALDSIAGKINGAFYHPATDDTANGWASPVLSWQSYTSVYEVSFLKPNPGASPKNRRVAVVPDQVPTEFALSQNYPNPFNPTTTIEFDVPQTSIVTLKVYNLLGQEIATLLNKAEVEFSETVEFDASALPTGVYLYRIVAETVADADAGISSETFTKVMKMVLVK